MDLTLLDELPLPTLVVEAGTVIHANSLVGQLLGAPVTEIVGQRWSRWILAEERELLEQRNRLRLAGERVPVSYDTTLVGKSGARIPVHVRVAQHGARTLVHLLDLRGEARRRELLASLALLGAGVQRQRTDRDISAEVRSGLLALGLHSTFLVPAGDELRVDWTEDGTEVPLLEAALGLPIIGMRRPMTPAAVRVWQDGAAFLEDWPNEAERFVGAPIARVIRELPPPGAFAHAIAIRVDVGGSPSGVLVATGEWVRAQDLPAFRLFGAQISSALDAARSIAALEARNADLLALNKLSAVAANAADVATLLSQAEAVFREAAGVEGLGILLVEEERGVARLVHASRILPEVAAEVAEMPLDHPWIRAVVAEGRALCTAAELLRPSISAPMLRDGRRCAASVPLRFRSGTIGIVAADFRAPAHETEQRLPLLQAMASHLGAVLEGHRLLDDLRRRISELTLLNDVAVATGALDPVLLLDNALRLVGETIGADAGVGYLLDGGRLVARASIGITADELLAAPSSAPGIAEITLQRRTPVRWPGGIPDDERRSWIREKLGIRSAVSVPLVAKDRTVGVLVVGRRDPRPFSDAEVRLLTGVGVHLGMAADNARLFADTQRRLADLEAVNSLALRVFTTAPGDAGQLLHVTCREIAHALDARAAAILRLDDSGQRLVGVAGFGTPVPPEQLAIDVERTPVAAAALRRQEPAWAPDVVLQAPGDAGAAPPLSLLFVPLTSRSATRGLVAIADAPARRFGEAEVALAYALASEAAMGLENAELYSDAQRRVAELSRLNAENERLYADLRRSYAELARAQEQLIRQERLAALGQLAAVVAHEVRNPLAVIFNSLGTLRRLVQPAGDAKMLLDIMGEEADRLNRIVGDLLDFARPATPRLHPEPLDRLIEDAAQAALAHAEGGVRLALDVPADLPPVPMDAHLMRQALFNVMSNAVQAMPGGGTLTVSARVGEGAACIEIADTGIGIPEEVRHRIFEPFFTTRPTGTGLGLAVVKRILDDHRASIDLDSAERAGTRFVVRLPLEVPGVSTERPGMAWSI